MSSASTFPMANRQQRAWQRAELVQRLSAQLSISACSKPSAADFSAFPKYIRSTPIDAEYTSESHIGSVSPKQGAYGSVHLCRNHLGATFALKTVKVGNEKVLKMTINEYETLHQLRHPHIVSVYGLFLHTDTQEAALLLEWLPGQSLSELLATGRNFTGRN